MLSAYNARKVLRAGVTSVLDADCLWNIGCELRDAIEAGIVEGPRMRAGGQALMTMLGGTAGPHDRATRAAPATPRSSPGGT